MQHADFVHLHVHTEYSLLDGACRVDRLIDKAAKLKMPALAITDHGVLHGAVDFYQAAREAGVKPIVGCEAYIAPGDRRERKAASARDAYNHLLLLAKDDEGYQNLIKLVTAAHLEGFYYKPRIDKELLARHAKGLIGFSSCLKGEVPQKITAGALDQAKNALDEFRHIFEPGDFYLELQNHGIPAQREVNRSLIQWAKEFDMPMVATNDVHYIEKQHSHAHDCLVCIGTQTFLAEERRMRYVQEQFYLRTPEEMKELFAEVPEAIQNTIRIAEKCSLNFEFNKLRFPLFEPPTGFSRAAYLIHLCLIGLKKRFAIDTDGILDTTMPRAAASSATSGDVAYNPAIEADVGRVPSRGDVPTATSGDVAYNPAIEADVGRVPPRGDVPTATSGDVAHNPATEADVGRVPSRGDVPTATSGDGTHKGPTLQDVAEWKKTLPETHRKIIEQMEYELKVIEKTGFVSYFLIVGDFVSFAKRNGIAVGCRGSAAGSLVTYLLEISAVDPLRYGLLFERFLNPERISPPDIDIDLADDRRSEVIEYVRKKYGEQNVAQIITFGTLGAKAVVRDVGRVMGLGPGECGRIAKMIPNELKMTLHKALEQVPELKSEYQANSKITALIDTAFILENLSRNAGTHAAGVVIGAQPLVELLPLQKDEDGGLVTQYAMGPVGDLGLLKMDFLGLKTFTVIDEAVKLVKQTQGAELDIHHLPLDDAPTYDLLNKANTIGLFQLESGGMRDLCRKFQISSLEHIIALIALYRPGPMELIPDFIERRHGRKKIEYEHPLLEEICRETYGIMIYQEQVMQAAQVLAGFTLGSADILRRAMGKKKPEEMATQREVFLKGCWEKNKIPKEKANAIFDLLEKFAGYGFNKSHAAAYAVVAYQTAYLKANYPVEFMAALMSNDLSDTDKIALFIRESRAMGIEVAAPDINASGIKFTLERGSVERPSVESDRCATQSSIRFGLAAVKGVGENAVQSILDARAKGGAFQSLFDFCERVDARACNRKALESLIKCGAFDSLGEGRAQSLAGIDVALGRASSVQRDRASGQVSLFGVFDAQPKDAFMGLPAVSEWSTGQRLAHEKELLGFYVTGHPLAQHEDILRRYDLTATAKALEMTANQMVRMGGIVTELRLTLTKAEQKQMATFVLEDVEGRIEVLVFPETFAKFGKHLAQDRVIYLCGSINARDEEPKINAQEILPLEEVPKRFTKQIHVRLQAAHTTEATLQQLNEVFTRHAGQVPVLLCIVYPTREIVVVDTHSHFCVSPTPLFVRDVEMLLGEESVIIKPDTTLPQLQRRSFGNGNGGFARQKAA